MKKQYIENLTNQEKEIIVNKGTESPFTGEHNENFEAGVFICKACKAPLYESNSKFDSGCGWPSFDDQLEGAIIRSLDCSNNKIRTEICCKKCGGHLGHVFEGEGITKKNKRHCVNSLSIKFIPHSSLKQAIFGAGCFWSVQEMFRKINGVYMAQSGYMGGSMKNPTYEDVCKGETNHAEVVRVFFDDQIIAFSELLDVFWGLHDPTTLNQQGPDIGTQYRSVIFFMSSYQKLESEESIDRYQKNYSKKIVTQILPANQFYRAEEYHQNYLNKNNLGSCKI